MIVELTGSQTELLTEIAARYDMSEAQALEVIFDAARSAHAIELPSRPTAEPRSIAAWQAAGMSAKQAIVLITIEGGYSVAEGLRKAKVSESTYSRWLQQPGFRAERDALFARLGRHSRGKTAARE